MPRFAAAAAAAAIATRRWKLHAGSALFVHRRQVRVSKQRARKQESGSVFVHE
jgi:hypothetical protein